MLLILHTSNKRELIKVGYIYIGRDSVIGSNEIVSFRF